jgi:hypothetical protein
MNPAYVHKKFIFNEKIDEDYIYSLYEQDYVYIAEVFSSSWNAEGRIGSLYFCL